MAQILVFDDTLLMHLMISYIFGNGLNPMNNVIHCIFTVPPYQYSYSSKYMYALLKIPCYFKYAKWSLEGVMLIINFHQFRYQSRSGSRHFERNMFTVRLEALSFWHSETKLNAWVNVSHKSLRADTPTPATHSTTQVSAYPYGAYSKVYMKNDIRLLEHIFCQYINKAVDETNC